MAFFSASERDVCRNGLQRLVVALAGCCLLTLGARAQPAGAAPTPVADIGVQITTPATPTPEQAASEPTTADAANAGSPPSLEPEDPKQAVQSAQAHVAQVEEQSGKNSRQSAEARLDLAELQKRAGDREGAEQSYLTAIEIYRSLDGAFTPLAIEPLTALGDDFKERKDYVSALSAYTEARTISRHAYGLLNEDQIPLLDRLTETMIELNKPAEADQHQQEALRLVERQYPPESNEALAALYKYAGWLREQGRFSEERDLYMRALRTIRDHYGKDDLHEVPALAAIGNSFRTQRLPEATGIGSLRDALQLMVARGAPDKVALAGVLRDIGDWDVAFSKVEYDGADYKRAWQYLGEVPEGDKLRKQWFTATIYVLSEPISLLGLSQEPKAPSGHVVVKFDLDKYGHTSNPTIIESEPAGLKDDAVLRHIRHSRFRPQMVDGEPVARTGLQLQFSYRYLRDAVKDKGDNAGKR
ncbi:MAG TPA: tetratricopeptide repeat protein [Gammaproteobacteria bacterium]|nr:tetratricopeptide repeat protein [Gammaproteobacteria bacterium]